MTEEIKNRLEQIQAGKVPDGYQYTWSVMPDGWKYVPLSKLYRKSRKKNIDHAITNVFTNSALYGIIPQSEYFEKDIANSENTDGYYIVQPDDYIYNPRISEAAPYGPFNKNATGTIGIVSPLYTVLAPKSEYKESKYLQYFFASTQWFKYAYSVANYGARFDRMNITDTDFLALPVVFPPLPEQQKIAEILTQCDKVIKLHQCRIEEIKKLKKACLNKMFPKKGSNVPEIRFPGFTDAWEQRKVGELASDTFGGGTPATSNTDFWNGSIPWIQSSDLTEHQVFGVVPKKYISKAAVMSSATKIVPENSLAIITRVGVGKLAVMPFSYTTSQDFLSLGKLINVDIEFAAYMLYKKLQGELNSVQGTSIKGITKNDLLAKVVFVPERKEQETIGAFFRNLDNLIVLHQRMLNEKQELKKALMQLLLTGIVRVTT